MKPTDQDLAEAASGSRRIFACISFRPRFRRRDCVGAAADCHANGHAKVSVGGSRRRWRVRKYTWFRAFVMKFICFNPFWTVLAVVFALIDANLQKAFAESIFSALARAYAENPDLNKGRARVRARDNGVSNALAGLRPKANIQADAGPQFNKVKIPIGSSQQSGLGNFGYADYRGYPRGATLNVSQTIFDGGATSSNVGRARSDIYAARATLQLTEQVVLQDAAVAYVDVLRDTAALGLHERNVKVLEQQLSQTRYSFEIGEVTRTDVAQAEASLSQARSELYSASADLTASSAKYRQVIGVEPGRLEPARPLDALLPGSVSDATGIALAEHPSVVAALHQLDSGEFALKAAESALSPTLSVNGQVANQYDAFLGYPNSRQFSASVSAQLNVPLYQGGSEFASIREAKEELGEATLNADLQRDGVRASVVASFGRLKAAKASIAARRAAVEAAGLALAGVRAEAKFGQRTVLDVLNAQQALLNARVALVSAQRDHVVASYAAVASIGRLSAKTLGLHAALYDPVLHYERVSEQWIGVDAPEGK
jgi:outer membrane protein